VLSRTLVLTTLALVAFASNSVLCRFALADGSADPAAFTWIRLASGALALWILVAATSRRGFSGWGGSWLSGAMLFLYAIGFSFAYGTLSVATGALILFPAVQMTMIGVGIARGERPTFLEWVGLAVAAFGIAYLMAPGVSAPEPMGAGLMAIAGVAWGVYSLRGKGVASPVSSTADNFVRSIPFAALAGIAFASQFEVSPEGAALAAASGAITSGLGYVAWYAALPGLTATRAAIVQLAVPVVAAIGGVAFLSEPFSARLAISAVLTLGGVGLATITRTAGRRTPNSS
jgi:drug/metabolite transporter (DMT)-like permease